MPARSRSTPTAVSFHGTALVHAAECQSEDARYGLDFTSTFPSMPAVLDESPAWYPSMHGPVTGSHSQIGHDRSAQDAWGVRREALLPPRPPTEVMPVAPASHRNSIPSDIVSEKCWWAPGSDTSVEGAAHAYRAGGRYGR